MYVEWTVTESVDFSDEHISRIANSILDAINKGTITEKQVRPIIIDAITDIACGFDDELYYTWTNEATEQVYNAVLEKMGGIQTRMDI